MNYKIILINPDNGAERASWILPLPIIIGRSSSAQITIHHASISRNHCQFVNDAQGGLVVRDLDSKNGTYVDERRIEKSNLMPGDVIRIGALTLRIEWTDAAIDEGRDFGTVCELDVTQPLKHFSKDDIDSVEP